MDYHRWYRVRLNGGQDECIAYVSHLVPSMIYPSQLAGRIMTETGYEYAEIIERYTPPTLEEIMDYGDCHIPF